MIGMDDMKRIVQHTGDNATVIVLQYGKSVSEEGELLGITVPFCHVKLKISEREHKSIPFIGYGNAVRKIILNDGSVIFDNPEVEGLKSPEDVPTVRDKSYGVKTARHNICCLISGIDLGRCPDLDKPKLLKLLKGLVETLEAELGILAK